MERLHNLRVTARRMELKVPTDSTELEKSISLLTSAGFTVESKEGSLALCSLVKLQKEVEDIELFLSVIFFTYRRYLVSNIDIVKCMWRALSSLDTRDSMPSMLIFKIEKILKEYVTARNAGK